MGFYRFIAMRMPLQKSELFDQFEPDWCRESILGEPCRFMVRPAAHEWCKKDGRCRVIDGADGL